MLNFHTSFYFTSSRFLASKEQKVLFVKAESRVNVQSEITFLCFENWSWLSCIRYNQGSFRCTKENDLRMHVRKNELNMQRYETETIKRWIKNRHNAAKWHEKLLQNVKINERFENISVSKLKYVHKGRLIGIFLSKLQENLW